MIVSAAEAEVTWGKGFDGLLAKLYDFSPGSSFTMLISHSHLTTSKQLRSFLYHKYISNTLKVIDSPVRIL